MVSSRLSCCLFLLGGSVAVALLLFTWNGLAGGRDLIYVTPCAKPRRNCSQQRIRVQSLSPPLFHLIAIVVLSACAFLACVILLIQQRGIDPSVSHPATHSPQPLQNDTRARDRMRTSITCVSVSGSASSTVMVIRCVDAALASACI
jgi:hypothetical protein